MKKIFTLITFALVALGAWATDTNYSPSAEYNLRPKADGSAWTTSPTAGAASAKATFEFKASAAFYAIQQYKLSNLADVTSMTLILTNGSGSDALAIWAFNGTFSAEMTAADFNTAFTNTTGITPGSGGTHTTTYLLKDGANSKSPNSTFVINGTALTTLKSLAAADGTITLLITNKTSDLDANSSSANRKYQSSNSSNANPPVLTVTTPDAVATVDYWTLSTNWVSTRKDGATAMDGDVLAVTSGSDNTSRGDIKNTTDSYRLDANKVLFIELACTAEGSKTNGADRKVGFTSLVSAVDGTTPLVVEQFVSVAETILSNGHELIYFNLANTKQYGLEKTPVIYKQGDSSNKFDVDAKTAAGEAIAAQESMTLSNVTFTLINEKVDGTAVPTNYNIYKMGSAKDIETLAKEYSFTPTAINNVNTQNNNVGIKKRILNGRLVIVSGNNTYSVAGALLK